MPIRLTGAARVTPSAYAAVHQKLSTLDQHQGETSDGATEPAPAASRPRRSVRDAEGLRQELEGLETQRKLLLDLAARS